MSYRFGDCLIDPGDEWEGFYNVKHVFLTHTHFDHIYGLNRVLEHNPCALVYTNEWGLRALISPKLNLSKYSDNPFILHRVSNVRIIEDEEVIPIGDDDCIQAIFTPGHEFSCVTWIQDNRIFTGDSWIPGIQPVTNLPNGNKELAVLSIEKIKKVSLGRELYSGHIVGNCSENDSGL